MFLTKKETEYLIHVNKFSYVKIYLELAINK